MPTGVRRSGGSRRSSACAVCTPTRRSAGAASAPSTTSPRASLIESLTADEPRLGSSGFVPTDRIAARVWHESAAALRGRARPGRRRARPPGLRHADRQRRRARDRHGHLVITAGAHSRRDRRRCASGLGDAWPTTSRSWSATAPSSTVVSIDDWADDAVHVGHRHAHGRPRRALQARRRDLRRRRRAPRHHRRVRRSRAETSRCSASTSPTPGQHIEHRLFVDHTAPKTKSHVTYKGALQGQGAHTVWIGNVLIRKVAEGIETYEENRNLVLTDGCQADSVPNLEIETGEIEGAGPRVRHRPVRRRAAVLPALARHRRERGAPARRARVLQRPDPPDRRARARGAAGSRPSRPSSRRTSSPRTLRGGLMRSSVPARSTSSARARRLRPSRSATRRSPSPATARSSSRSRTSAPTPPSR